MPQLNIFSPPSTIDEAFWRFHRENPLVFTKLIAMTREAKRSAGAASA